MLRRLQVRGFKSLVDVDRDLPRLAVLAGPNAAGKSNLLDAIYALARLGTSRTLADALAPPTRGFPAELFTLPPNGLPGLLEQRSACFTLEADLQLGATGGNGAIERVRYRIGVEIDPDSGSLAVKDEYLSRLSTKWQPRDSPRLEVSGDQLVIRQARGSGRPANEPLGANHTKLSDSRLAGARYPYFDRVREEFLRWRTFYLDPGEAMREAVPPRDVQDIGTRGEHLAPFLYGLKTKETKKFEAVRRALRSVIPAVGSLNVDLDAKRGTLDIQIVQDGTAFSSRIVSEGTLRVLALCAIAVTADRGVIAFEEPENGVQPQRLDRIAELLASAANRDGAQIIVTTHSPYFIAAMLEQARRDQTDVGLFSVTRDGRSTSIKRLEDFGLWESDAIEELLMEPDEYDKVAAVARRGWLDL